MYVNCKECKHSGFGLLDIIDPACERISRTKSGSELSNSLPDSIEKKLIYELADLETEDVRILALVMNQILNLIDAKRVDGEFLEIHYSPVPPVNEEKGNIS